MKKLFGSLVVLMLVMLVSAFPGAQSTPGTGVIAIKAGRLVHPDSGTTRDNQVILVEGSKIQDVGAAPIPPGATVIDLSTSTVLPGLFDAHTHLCANSPPPQQPGFRAALESLLLYTLTRSTGYRAIQGAASARSMLEAGFTTVRDVGNAGRYADTDLRRTIEDGLVAGPTIINAGRIITAYGGQFPEIIQPEKPEIGAPEYFYADTRDELKKAIRENAYYGARVIKVVVDDQRYVYSADDLKFIVSEAAAAGLKVAAHALTPAGAHNAAEAGVASIEHGFGIVDEDLAVAKKNDVVLVGTDWTRRYTEHLNMAEFHPGIVDRLKRALRAGIVMAYGTDVFSDLPNVTRGETAAGMVESWIQAGVPPRTILQGMTTNAAKLLGVEAERGAIKPGLAADIIATPENPLERPETLQHVTFVMKDGRVIRRSSQ